MVHRCMIKLVVIWLHVLVLSLLMCVCRTVRKWTTTPEQCDIHTQQGHYQYMHPHHHRFNHTLMNHN